MSMQEIQRLLSNPFFISAFVKHETGRKIHKYELKAIVDGCKEVHKNNVNMAELSQEERSELVEVYNRIADAVEQYVERSLRIQGRLEE